MLWRLHIKPDWSKGKTRTDVIDYCVNNKVAGIGWHVDTVPKSPEDYEIAARAKYSGRCSAITFAKNVSIGDLIWSRNGNGDYYLGRVLGPWFYCTDTECIDLDIPNQLPCEWIKVKLERVPGKVVACFRSPRALQSIEDSDESMLDRSNWLFNNCNRGEISPSERSRKMLTGSVFFKLISSEDCEDIVGLYLQKIKGYCITPSSCKKDTMAHEFQLKHSESFETALVQVKQGKVSLNEKSLGETDRIFLFTTEGYSSTQSSKVTLLNVDELYNFVEMYEKLLPERIQYWLYN